MKILTSLDRTSVVCAATLGIFALAESAQVAGAPASGPAATPLAPAHGFATSPFQNPALQHPAFQPVFRKKVTDTSPPLVLTPGVPVAFEVSEGQGSPKGGGAKQGISDPRVAAGDVNGDGRSIAVPQNGGDAKPGISDQASSGTLTSYLTTAPPKGSTTPNGGEGKQGLIGLLLPAVQNGREAAPTGGEAKHQVWEILPGQDSKRAFLGNQPIVERDVHESTAVPNGGETKPPPPQNPITAINITLPANPDLKAPQDEDTVRFKGKEGTVASVNGVTTIDWGDGTSSQMVATPQTGADGKQGLIALLLPAVQKVREATPNGGEGKSDIKIAENENPRPTGRNSTVVRMTANGADGKILPYAEVLIKDKAGQTTATLKADAHGSISWVPPDMAGKHKFVGTVTLVK